jgi:hypothetical protein
MLSEAIPHCFFYLPSISNKNMGARNCEVSSEIGTIQQTVLKLCIATDV